MLEQKHFPLLVLSVKITSQKRSKEDPIIVRCRVSRSGVVPLFSGGIVTHKVPAAPVKLRPQSHSQWHNRPVSEPCPCPEFGSHCFQERQRGLSSTQDSMHKHIGGINSVSHFHTGRETPCAIGEMWWTDEPEKKTSLPRVTSSSKWSLWLADQLSKPASHTVCRGNADRTRTIVLREDDEYPPSWLHGGRFVWDRKTSPYLILSGPFTPPLICYGCPAAYRGTWI